MNATPGEESKPDGEDAAIAGLLALQRKMTQAVFELAKQAAGGRPVPEFRGQHPKSHGCVWAEFAVAPHLLPEALRVGVFKEARTYWAIIRFSNGASFDDRRPDVHGMAIKLIGVEGPKVSPDEAATQDFILADHVVFFARDAAETLGVLKALAQKSPALLTSEQLVRLQAAQKPAPPSPLEATYWSQVPYRLGEGQAVKYRIGPGSDNTSGRRGPVASDGDEGKNALREALVAYLTTDRRAATFDFSVQLRDGDMPVEDPTVVWDEAASPPIKVATLRVPPQEFDTPERRAFGENLSYSPGHALREHRPIGGVNRARVQVYEAESAARHKADQAAPHEPTEADRPPTLGATRG